MNTNSVINLIRVVGLKIIVRNIQELLQGHRLQPRSDFNEGTSVKCDKYEVTNSGILIKIVNVCELSNFMSQNYFYISFANNLSFITSKCDLFEDTKHFMIT